MEDKQKNIIKFKIQRAYAMMLLYNDEKYAYIQNYIKRINFKIKDLSKLSHEQWLLFFRFLKDSLDKQLIIENNKVSEKDIVHDNKEKIIYTYKCLKCKKDYKSQFKINTYWKIWKYICDK